MMLAKQSVAKASVRPARQAVVVRASSEQQSRRAVLGFVGAAAAALLAPKAEAIGLPWQESTGGMVKGGGSSPKSATRASMEGYTLEGTRKQGITGKRKAKLLAKAREEAQEKAK